jgi:transposase
VRDTEFLSTVLGVQPPWHVESADLDLAAETIEALVVHEGPVACPQCGVAATRHDHRERRWRHLDLFQYKFYVVARVPRIDCREHGVQQLSVPWAEDRSRFTQLFESLAIGLHEMSIAAVARRLRLSWDEVDGIMARAVARGLQRRAKRPLRFIGIDEKAVKKRHRYFTIVSDLETSTVIWVGRGRKRETLDRFWAGLSNEERVGIEGIAMDMWPAYFESTLAAVPQAAHKIVFDKFHIVKHLVHAVDLTRRAEVRQSGEDGAALKRTRYTWLRRHGSMTHGQKLSCAALREQYRRVARAWELKELFARLWDYRYEGAARTFFAAWYASAIRSRLRHVKTVAKMIKSHFENVLTYLRLPITNAPSESINSKIQLVKARARGFRSERRFANAILFHCGSLSLLPGHTSS